MLAERIANSRATIETENYTNSSPSGNDTYSTFHKKAKSGEEGKTDEDHGVFNAFKDSNETTENKQIQLASNAMTNDTDAITGPNSGVKKILADNDFEEIKEEDENNESYDARKQFENIDIENIAPDFELSKKPVSAGVYDLEMGGKQEGK